MPRDCSQLHLAKRCGNDAMLEASERADQLLDEGDMAGAETWHRILNAIERLEVKVPAEGRRCTDKETELYGMLQASPHIGCMADNEALDRAIRSAFRRLHEAPEWCVRLQAICDGMAPVDQTAATPSGEASKQPMSHGRTR